jgi:hypothetical protein
MIDNLITLLIYGGALLLLFTACGALADYADRRSRWRRRDERRARERLARRVVNYGQEEES